MDNLHNLSSDVHKILTSGDLLRRAFESLNSANDTRKKEKLLKQWEENDNWLCGFILAEDKRQFAGSKGEDKLSFFAKKHAWELFKGTYARCTKSADDAYTRGEVKGFEVAVQHIQILKERLQYKILEKGTDEIMRTTLMGRVETGMSVKDYQDFYAQLNIPKSSLVPDVCVFFREANDQNLSFSTGGSFYHLRQIYDAAFEIGHEKFLKGDLPQIVTDERKIRIASLALVCLRACELTFYEKSDLLNPSACEQIKQELDRLRDDLEEVLGMGVHKLLENEVGILPEALQRGFREQYESIESRDRKDHFDPYGIYDQLSKLTDDLKPAIEDQKSVEKDQIEDQKFAAEVRRKKLLQFWEQKSVRFHRQELRESLEKKIEIQKEMLDPKISSIKYADLNEWRWFLKKKSIIHQESLKLLERLKEPDLPEQRLSNTIEQIANLCDQSANLDRVLGWYKYYVEEKKLTIPDYCRNGDLKLCAEWQSNLEYERELLEALQDDISDIKEKNIQKQLDILCQKRANLIGLYNKHCWERSTETSDMFVKMQNTPGEYLVIPEPTGGTRYISKSVLELVECHVDTPEHQRQLNEQRINRTACEIEARDKYVPSSEREPYWKHAERRKANNRELAAQLADRQKKLAEL